MSEKNAEVGYRKPPSESRFKPGQSGNPRGRPKRNRAEDQEFAAAFAKVMSEPVKVRSGGRTQKMSSFEAIIRVYRDKALSGDTRAFQFLAKFVDKYRMPERRRAGLRPHNRPETKRRSDY